MIRTRQAPEGGVIRKRFYSDFLRMILSLIFSCPYFLWASSPSLLGTLHSYNDNQISFMSQYFQEDLEVVDRRRIVHSLNEAEVSVDVRALTGFTGGILYGGLQYLVRQLYTKNTDTQPFMDACRLNDIHSVRALLTRSYDTPSLISAKNKNGETALMAACKDGFVEIVKALLEAGADTSDQNVLGYSSIIFAARTGKHQVLAVLLRAGVDPNSTGNDGRTAAHWAAHHGHVSFLKGLLASTKIDLTQQDTSGSTALMLAASEDRLNVLKALISHSRDHLNLIDNTGETALHRAAYRNHLSSLRALLFAGADPTISNWEGLSPHQIVFGIRRRVCSFLSPSSKLLLLFYNLRIAMGALTNQLCKDVVGEIALKVIHLSYTIY